MMKAVGVSIPPLIYMARMWFNNNADIDTVFVSCVRTPRDIIFRHQLEWMATRLTNFRLNIVCEKSGTGDSWSGYRGLLNLGMLKLRAPDILERQGYWCGRARCRRAVGYLLESIESHM